LTVIIFFYNLDRISFTPKEENYENYHDYFIQKVKCEQRKSNLNIDTVNASLVFDISQYLKVFDNLSLENGWILDCFYFYNGDAGKPIFFARRNMQNRDSLIKSFENRAIYNYTDSIDILDHIKINNSEKGFYQFLIFTVIGDEFAKFAHSNYGNTEIICSKRALKDIINRNDAFHDFDSQLKKKIEKIDYRTKYNEYKDSVTFRFVTFNAWYGFAENKVSIRKEFPHKLKLFNDSLLIEYNCGIRF